MMASLSIALSGLTANTKHLKASASNTANSGSDGPFPNPADAPAGGDAPAAYRPIRVVQQSIVAGGRGAGTAAAYQAVDPAYVRKYDPSASYADREGMVAAPNVDPANEAIVQVQAAGSYRLNLEALERTARLLRATIDLKA